MLPISKSTTRWENSKHVKYKYIVPSISHKNLTGRAILFKKTSRKIIPIISRLKTVHSMIKGHKRKIATETLLECFTFKEKETPEYFLLNCKEYDTE